MLIAEDLYLLLTKGTGTQEAPGTQRGTGLTAALVADLVFAGRATLTEEKRPRIHITAPEPIGNPVLDFGLARLAEKNGKRLDQLVTWSKLDPEGIVVESLVAQGVLAYGERTFLGMGKPRTPEVDPGPERQLRDRLAAVLAGAAPASPADATLLSILQGLGVARKVLAVESGDLRARDLKARIEQIVEHSPTGEAVDRAIQAMNAAFMAAAMVPIMAAGGGAAAAGG